MCPLTARDPSPLASMTRSPLRLHRVPPDDHPWDDAVARRLSWMSRWLTARSPCPHETGTSATRPGATYRLPIRGAGRQRVVRARRMQREGTPPIEGRGPRTCGKGTSWGAQHPAGPTWRRSGRLRPMSRLCSSTDSATHPHLTAVTRAAGPAPLTTDHTSWERTTSWR